MIEKRLQQLHSTKRSRVTPNYGQLQSLQAKVEQALCKDSMSSLIREADDLVASVEAANIAEAPTAQHLETER